MKSQLELVAEQCVNVFDRPAVIREAARLHLWKLCVFAAFRKRAYMNMVLEELTIAS